MTGGGNRHNSDEIRRTLARVPIIRTACDLDLLLFLYRHPRMLVTSERLAEFVGYEIKEIAKSLDALIETGLLTRNQNPVRAARMYCLTLDGPEGGRLSSILETASTRQGRDDLIKALDRARP